MRGRSLDITAVPGLALHPGHISKLPAGHTAYGMRYTPARLAAPGKGPQGHLQGLGLALLLLAEQVPACWSAWLSPAMASLPPQMHPAQPS